MVNFFSQFVKPEEETKPKENFFNQFVKPEEETKPKEKQTKSEENFFSQFVKPEEEQTQSKEDAPDPLKVELDSLDSLDQADRDDAAYDPAARTRGNLNQQMQDMGKAAELRNIKKIPEWQKLDEADLDKNKDWTSAAEVIYRHENNNKEFDAEKEGQSLSEWFKTRHSALSNNVGNLALTAIGVTDMSPEVKDAWVKSITTYGLTETNLRQIAEGIAQATFKDAVFWTGLVASLGFASILKPLIGKAITAAGKKGFVKSLGDKVTAGAVKKRAASEARLIKNLVAKGVSEDVAKDAILKGVTQGVSTKLLEKVAKKEINRKTIKNIGEGAALDVGYELTDNISRQNLNIGLGVDTEKVVDTLETYRKDKINDVETDIGKLLESKDTKYIKNKNFSKKDFDYLDLGIDLGIGVLLGGGIGWGLGKIGNKKQLKDIIDGDDAPIDINASPTTLSDNEGLIIPERFNQTISKETTPTSNIDLNTDMITEANAISRSLEVDGDVNINTASMRAEVNKKIADLKKEASAFKRTKVWRGKNRGQRKQWTSNYKNKLKEISDDFKNRDEKITKAFNNAGIEIKKTGKTQYTGKKITEDIDLGKIDVLGTRSKKEKVIAKLKQYAYDDGGLGDPAKAARTRKDRALTTAKRNVETRYKKLKKAIKKDYKTSLREIPRKTYTLMTRAMRGDQEAIDALGIEAPEVLESILEMSKNINYLQQQLLDSGAIKPDSPLETKIVSSMKDGGDPELYVTTQYEVFDNPDFPKSLRDTSDGQIVLREVKDYLISQRAIDNKPFAEALALKRAGLPMSPKQEELYENMVGKDGIIDINIADLLRVTDENDIFKIFGNDAISKANYTKILTRKQDIPEEIRALLGEYKDPFTNYSNTSSRIFQTIETFKYEEEIARLVRAGKIEGASTRKIQSEEITTSLESQLPNLTGVVRPIDQDRVIPLDGLYGTPEVADYIAQGNEIAATWVTPTIGKFLVLQGYARAAKTVYSTSGLSRNFIGAGWMAFGAGYINPLALNQMYKAARGLALLSNTEQRDVVEKGLALGFMQSGTDLGSFKGALKDAGNKEFWDMSSPIYRGGQDFKRKARAANTSAIKFYQSMDDMWKMFAFSNEKGTQRRILLDKGFNPEQEVRRFMSGDGTEIIITLLDQVAADKVNRKMQNYAGVPKFVKGLRVTPIADFIAFKSEIIRTQKNILVDALTDIKEGRELSKASGGERGRWQQAEGYKSLSTMIAAQSIAAGVAYGSYSAVTSLAGKAGEIVEGIQAFEADYNKGALYMYLGEIKDGVGKRFNLSYIMPWAPTQNPIIAGIRALTSDKDIGTTVSEAFQDAVVRPITDTFGASMLTSGLMDLADNRDEYGRPIWQPEQYGVWKSAVNVANTIFGPMAPGGGARIADVKESYEFKGKDFGLKGKGKKKIYQTDAWMNMLGIGAEEYDIGKSLSFKMVDIKKRMGQTDNIFKEVYQSGDIQTKEDLLNAYQESMDYKVKLSKEIGYYIRSAKKTGMSVKDIFKSITKEGLFTSRLDKQMMLKLVKDDVFIPPIPNIKDIEMWGRSLKIITGQKPPAREIYKDLFRIYKEAIRK